MLEVDASSAPLNIVIIAPFFLSVLFKLWRTGVNQALLYYLTAHKLHKSINHQ